MDKGNFDDKPNFGTTSMDGRLNRYENDILRAQLRDAQEKLLSLEGRYLALLEEHAYLKMGHEQLQKELRTSPTVLRRDPFGPSHTTRVGYRSEESS